MSFVSVSMATWFTRGSSKLLMNSAVLQKMVECVKSKSVLKNCYSGNNNNNHDKCVGIGISATYKLFSHNNLNFPIVKERILCRCVISNYIQADNLHVSFSESGLCWYF